MRCCAKCKVIDGNYVRYLTALALALATFSLDTLLRIGSLIGHSAIINWKRLTVREMRADYLPFPIFVLASLWHTCHTVRV